VQDTNAVIHAQCIQGIGKCNVKHVALVRDDRCSLMYTLGAYATRLTICTNGAGMARMMRS